MHDLIGQQKKNNGQISPSEFRNQPLSLSFNLFLHVKHEAYSMQLGFNNEFRLCSMLLTFMAKPFAYPSSYPKLPEVIHYHFIH